jgi:hypothetical protein
LVTTIFVVRAREPSIPQLPKLRRWKAHARQSITVYSAILAYRIHNPTHLHIQESGPLSEAISQMLVASQMEPNRYV